MKRVLGVILLAVMLSVAADGQPADSPVDPSARPFPNVTLQTLDGSSSIEIESFRGRPVLLTFWASWCGPCRIELPELEKLYAELAGDGFVLLTVNVDDSPISGTRFLQRVGVDVPVYRMHPRDLLRLGVNALPTNILLDGEGRIVLNYKGYSPSVPEEIRRFVQQAREGTAEDDTTSS